MYNELQGQWAYGFASSGSPVVVPTGKTLLQVLCYGGTGGGTVTIFGGAAITLAVGQELEIRLLHRNVVAGASPNIACTGTATAYADWVGPGSSI